MMVPSVWPLCYYLRNDRNTETRNYKNQQGYMFRLPEERWDPVVSAQTSYRTSPHPAHQVLSLILPSRTILLACNVAFLNCRVKNLGNRTVSWVRHRDIHLLTAGRYTYTSDQRFEALHTPHTEDWTLRIKYPQKKDNGIYECQISTTPPIGRYVHLNIVGSVEERPYTLYILRILGFTDMTTTLQAMEWN
ncbi:hypothetical protein M8J75_012792 [Diaphorina citri]|nr:hypothetical protein M8J75_012792 [Diaphorina citri]